MTEKNPRSTRDTGAALEKRVAHYYEALGFQVTRDVRVDGHQIDLLAKRYVAGASTVTLAIEVKYRSGVLGINDVTPFINTARNLISSMIVNGAVLVTNGRFSADAKTAIIGIDTIRLLREHDLEQDLFNNSESLLRVIKDYERQSVYSHYYPLHGRLKNLEINDVLSYIIQWSSEATSLLLILGDFGSGKSTILDRAFYEFSKQRLTDDDALFPVILKLRKLRQASDLWDFIESSLRDNQYISPPKSVFYSELEAGRLMLFLDGLDEIHTGATAQDRAEFLHMLRPLIKSPSPCVLSSRPTFFESAEEIISMANDMLEGTESLRRMPIMGVNKAKLLTVLRGERDLPLFHADLTNALTLAQLDDEQVTAAINVRREEIKTTTGMSVTRFKEYLYEIYDLQDLMRRPLLLDMIIKTVASGSIDLKSQDTVGPSTLYDVYTQGSAIRDKDKGISSQYLHRDQRLDDCRHIAVKMLRKGEIVLSHDDVLDCARQTIMKVETGFPTIPMSDLERAVTDVKTCSFLRFSDDGSLQFTHTSYYEFFVAQYIYLLAFDNTQKFLEFAQLKLSKEIVYFLGSYARDQDNFSSFLKLRLKENLDERERSLVATIIFSSATLLGEIPLSGGRIADVDIRRAEIGARLDGCQLLRCTIVDLEAWDFIATNVAMHDCMIRRASFEKSRLHFIANGLELANVVFYGSHLDLQGMNVRVELCTMHNCVLLVNSDIHLDGLDTNEKSRIEIGDAGFFKVFSNSHIKDSTILSSRPSEVYSGANNVFLEDCLLGGVWLDGRDLFSDVKIGARRRIKLCRCRGLIIADLGDNLRSNAGFHNFQNENPDLTIIEARLVEMMQVRKTRPRNNGVGKDHRRISESKIISEHMERAALVMQRSISKWQIPPASLPQSLQRLLQKHIK